MSHRKYGLRVIGLCLMAVLGLMAFSAVGAQAAEFLVNKKPIVKPLLPEIQAEIDTLNTLLTKLSGGQTIDIDCLEVKVDTGLLHENGDGLGTILFSNCSTKVNGTLTPGCKPLGEPIIATALALVILHKDLLGNEEPYILFEPQTGTTFTTLKFKEETCIIPPEVPITGSAVFKDCKLELLEEKVTHLFEEVQLDPSLGDGLFFGKQKAFIDGSTNWFLIGEHKGMTWSAH
jgi:hypothetical protein